MVSTALAEFCEISDIPETARAMMRLSLMDWCGCALAGRGQSASQPVREMVLAEAGTAQAALVGCGTRIPMRGAALANGVASHSLDFDDTHFAHIGHPSVAVIPAALAVAQHVGASGADFLDAALVGAEASIRVGIWLGRSHYQAGFHQTATAGAFGATIAAGRLLGLSTGQMQNALGVVSTRASGLKNQFGGMGKPLNAGIAASNGVEAALLAQAEFISVSGGIEGEFGFGATHSGEADEAGFSSLGDEWLMELVSHKFHACCHGLHAMLEALTGLRSSDVRSVTVHTNPRWRSVCNIRDPKTGLEAKFSYRQVAAMALHGLDTADLLNYNDGTAIDPALSRLRGQIEVLFDPAIAETETQLVVLARDGSQCRRFHDLKAPISVETRRTKILAKANSLMGEARAKQVWAAIDGGPNLPELTTALTI
jgi:2-methylcitrate dehydratase PrpD